MLTDCLLGIPTGESLACFALFPIKTSFQHICIHLSVDQVQKVYPMSVYLTLFIWLFHSLTTVKCQIHKKPNESNFQVKKSLLNPV